MSINYWEDPPVPALDDWEAWLDLLDRLRRQALDVVGPVLALVAAGQVTGIDWVGVAGLLAGGSIVTVVAFVAGTSGAGVWQRAVITVAGAALAVLGTDTAGWLEVDWPVALLAIVASAVLSVLRSGLTPVAARRAMSSLPC
jgi:hypothetical protein